MEGKLYTTLDISFANYLSLWYTLFWLTLHLWLAPTPLVSMTLRGGSHNGHTAETDEVGVWYICCHNDPVSIDNQSSVLQITNASLDKNSLPAMPAAAVSTNCVLDSEAYITFAYSLIFMLHAKPRTHPAPSSILWTAVACPMGLWVMQKRWLVPDQMKNWLPPTLPWHTGPCHPSPYMVNFPLHLHQSNLHQCMQGYNRNGHLMEVSYVDWQLSFSTLSSLITQHIAHRYCCISFYHTVCLCTLTTMASVNIVIFTMTPNSILKIDSYVHSTVATSSAACGLGITCDMWFLVCYNWVDIETFIVHTVPTATSSHADIVICSIHYKTHDQEIFLFEELGRCISFSRLTGNNVPLTKFFLVWPGIFIPRNTPGMPRSEPGKNTCPMSAIPSHEWA